MERRKREGGNDSSRPVQRARRQQDPEQQQPEPAGNLRIRIDNTNGEEEELNIFSLPELGDQVFSFLTERDLLSAELVSRSFRQIILDADLWGRSAHRIFGVPTEMGKEAWKLEWFRNPIHFTFSDCGDFSPGEEYIAGYPSLAANSSYLVSVSADVDIDGDFNTDIIPGFEGSNAIIVRDAKTLSYIQAIPSDITNSRVSICGQQGSELIVTSNRVELSARRVVDQEEFYWDLENFLPADAIKGFIYAAPTYNIPLLGLEKNLIVVVAGRVCVFKVGNEEMDLVELKTISSISQHFGTPEQLESCVDDPSTFVFYEPIWKHICVWRLNDQTGSVAPIQIIDVERSRSLYREVNALKNRTVVNDDDDGEIVIRSVALSTNYIIGADRRKKIYIWSRETGLLLHEGLKDVELDLNDDIEDEDINMFISPLCMKALKGDVLVSASRTGAHIVVWNLRKGSVLARRESPHYDVLDGVDGVDATSMVRLPTFDNAFAIIAGSTSIWAFPSSDASRQKISSIAQRERSSKIAYFSFDRHQALRGDELLF